jgi:hypothetical protein
LFVCLQELHIHVEKAAVTVQDIAGQWPIGDGQRAAGSHAAASASDVH